MGSYEYHLSHHGIKGQKWGVRRFQEEDGTLTAEGRARYLEELGRLKLIKNDAKKEYKQSKPPLYKRNGDTLLQYRNNRASYEFSKKEIKDAKAKYRMENGSLKNSKRRKNLEEKYIKEGMSKEDAAIAAYRRAKTERTLAIAGGIAIAAAGSYAAYKHWDLNTDKFIKGGTKIQRISSSDDADISRAFYGSYKKGDIRKYEGMFGAGHLQKGGRTDIYKLNADVQNDGLKILGRKNGTNVLNEMIKDEKFKNDLISKYNKYSKGTSLEGFDEPRRYKRFIANVTKGKIDKKDYEFFNQHLVFHGPENQSLIDRFYKNVKDKGYGGLLDINDKKFSGYRAKVPTIFIDDKKLSNVRVSRIHYNSDLLKLKHKEYIKALFPETAKEILKTPSLYAFAGAKLASKAYDKKKTSNQWKQEIASYKKEHPNTKLSDREILRNIYGRK